LAVLERLVHYKRFDALQAHILYVIDVPEASIQECGSVPRGWNAADLSPAAQKIGDRWCDERLSPALRVPSAVTHGEFNLLLNSRHPDWKWQWVARPLSFAFDARLQDLVQAAAPKA
jgi:RES domain-containing protein